MTRSQVGKKKKTSWRGKHLQCQWLMKSAKESPCLRVAAKCQSAEHTCFVWLDEKTKKESDQGRFRTADLRSVNAMLWPTELPDRPRWFMGVQQKTENKY